MDLHKIGKFIFELRNEKGLSQKELANMIPVTREAVSKWENGKSLPDSSTLLILTKIFNITIDELLCGEKTTQEENAKNITLELVDEFNLKNKKIRKILGITTSIIITLIVAFFVYYFISSYNTIRIYKINGYGENFYTNNGILITTKQKSYLRLGKIESKTKKNIDQIESIKLYYINSQNKKNIIYEDNSTDILISTFYGYDEYFSYENIVDMEKKLYMEIVYSDNKETILLDVVKDFSNNLIFYNKDKRIAEANKIESKYNEKENVKNIISEIKNKGKEENEMYVFIKKTDSAEIIISYFMNEINLEITKRENKKIWTYYTGKNCSMHYTEYNKNKESYNLFINCKNLKKLNKEEKKIYDNFFDNMNKYLL